MDSLSKLKELCNSGNSESLDNFLASCANSGNTQWIVDAAEQGDSDAQYALSELYYHSEEEDNQTAELAFSWAMQSAQQGNSWGENNVGYCYLHGYGINQDEKLGLEWYKKSANQGNNLALYNLGECYQDGIGTEKDDVTAFQFYLKAAEGGKPNAQNFVGDLYSEGIGTEKDFNEAIKWYEKAADNGVTDSMISLVMVYWGLAFGPDYCNYQKVVKKLEDFYLKVPDDEDIQYFMAFVLYFGIGTKSDKNRAMLVWPPLGELLSDNEQLPLGLIELAFFYSLGQDLMFDEKNFKCESPIINEFYYPLMLSQIKAFQNCSYTNYHYLKNHNDIRFVKGVKAGDFYRLLKDYDHDPWDVLQFASPSIREQLFEYFQHEQEEDFKKTITSEESDLMASFLAYSTIRKMTNYPWIINTNEGKSFVEKFDKQILNVTESPEVINNIRDILMKISEPNNLTDLIAKSAGIVSLFLYECLIFSDIDYESSSLFKYEDFYTLKKITEQERYKDIFDYVLKLTDETANDGEETEYVELDSTLPQDQVGLNEGTTENLEYPIMLRHGRLRVRKFQEYVCKNYLRKWFDISINDIAYLLFVFFGHGIKLAYPLTFKGNKKNLVCFIKF